MVVRSPGTLVGLIAVMGTAVELSLAQGAAWRVESLGVPIRAVTYGNSHAVLAPGPGGQGAMFYTSYYCSTGGELIGYDFRGGRMVRHKLGSQGGYAVALGSDDAVYVGGVNPGNLYRYDFKADKFTTVNTSRFGVDYIWDAAADKDGRIYCAAGYPRSKLVAYDPGTNEAVDLGEMAPGEQYLRSLCVDSQGKVWCGVGMKAHLVRYDPADGSKREMLPPDLASNACVGHVEAVGDYVLAGVIFDCVLLVYDARTGEILHRIPSPQERMGWGVVPGGTGHTAYLNNGLNFDLYRCDLRTGALTPVVQSLGQVQLVEKDRWLHIIDDPNYLVYDLQARKVISTRQLTEGGDGMDIFALTAGPDGNIYGSTYINMHLFRCDTAAGKLTDLGKCSRWPGQVDSLSLGADGRIYIGAYIYAVLSTFDPKLPWRPGTEPDSNPREIGPVGKGQYRTQTNCLGPDGRLYVGSVPSYNSAPTGAFTICDPRTGRMDVRTDFVPGGAVEALAADRKYVYAAGGGEFFVYDPARDEKRFKETRPCRALAVAGSGKVIGSGGGKLFLYDPEQNRITAEKPNPAGDFTHMTTGPDGAAYGVNGAHVARVDKDGQSVEILARGGGKFAAVDREGRVYFARGAQLFRAAASRPAP